MQFRNAIRVIVVLAATGGWAQSAQPGTTAGAPILNVQAPAPTARRGPAGQRKASDPLGVAAMREQVQDLEHTVSQMRVALKEMQAKAGKNKPMDAVTKANLDMWELMVGHLDKELQQLRVTLATREDMEYRRAAMYKQADAKAAAEAQAFRAAQAAKFAQGAQNATGTATTAPSAQSAEQSAPAQSAPAQASDAH